MIALPKDPTNPLQLADWLEITTMLTADGNASRGDLERALYRHSFYELRDNEAIERKILDTFSELDQRATSAQIAYPFDLSHGIVQIRSNWGDYLVYVFCLCLSYFGAQSPKPRKLFEQIATVAAKVFLQGDAIDFGHPRTVLSASMPDAVRELCDLIGEGEDYSGRPQINRKDDKLDLVAWRSFPDKQSSKLLMFGQCASGWDWEEKITELIPSAFCSYWMRSQPVSPLIRSFFVPHRIDRLSWEHTATHAGIIFDRCRIAFWAHGAKGDNLNEYRLWVQECLSGIETN